MSSTNTRLQSRKRVIAHSEIPHGHGSKHLTGNGCHQSALVLLSLHGLRDFLLELREVLLPSSTASSQP